MVSILKFSDAIADAQRYSKRHLLLGNGFSIACRPDIFVYRRLFEQADFTKLPPAARKSFSALGTFDFERVIKALRDAKTLLSIYTGIPGDVATAMQKDADSLRELLVRTIAISHPERPSDILEDEYAACRSFLRCFNSTYTLNYDLLLYWTQMHSESGSALTPDDGFRKPEYDLEAAYVTWEPDQSHEQNTWFLHGALHVFDTGTEIRKYTWKNTGIRLIEQIRDALQKDYFPLFVAEGTSHEKLERIRHSDYLAKAYRSFSSIGEALFVYGHSLAENDQHYLNCIERGKLKHLYVGIYGNPGSSENAEIIRRALGMRSARGARRPLTVSFFDSGSARVWGR